MHVVPDKKYLPTHDVQLVAVVTHVRQGEVHEEHLFELSTNYDGKEHDVHVVEVVTQVKQLLSQARH